MKQEIITNLKVNNNEIRIMRVNNEEYNNLTLIYNDSFHDRFIILDKKKMYHLGTSINNAGTKTFSINKIEDTKWLELVLKQI